MDEDKRGEKAKMISCGRILKTVPSEVGNKSCIFESGSKCWPSYRKLCLVQLKTVHPINLYLKVIELRLLTYWTTKVNRSSLVGLVLNPSVCIILEKETPTLSEIMFI